MINLIFCTLAVAAGFLGGIALTEYNHRKKVEAAELAEFAAYISEARETFVLKIWELHPGPETRVMAENILIAYDQLRERLNIQKETEKPPFL